MPFKKGISGNPNGRPKGSRNRNKLRETVEGIVNKHFDAEQVAKDLQQMDAKDRLSFMLRLLEFSLPKLKSTELTTDFDHLSDQDLDEIINKLMKGDFYENKN